MDEPVVCPNCGATDGIIEQVTARGVFTRELNAWTSEVSVVSWEPEHDFYECFHCCGIRWT